MISPSSSGWNSMLGLGSIPAWGTMIPQACSVAKIIITIIIIVISSSRHKKTGFPSGSKVKNPPAMQELQETRAWSLGQKDPLEEHIANHSSLLAWRISRTEEPGGLTVHGVTKSQTSETAWHSMAPLGNWKKKEAVEWGFPGGSDGKESACNVGDLGLILGSERSPREGNGNPLQYSRLENSMDRGAWWAI